jgi:hypothetical protein
VSFGVGVMDRRARSSIEEPHECHECGSYVSLSLKADIV